MKYMPIREWFQKTFSFVPSSGTITSYIKTNQIQPKPVKMAGRWMVKSDAVFTGLPQSQNKSISDPLVERIFKNGCTTPNS
ncbi:excisionase [Vibrio salinus]|uniref:excisionase n=1 Tax=Vibrio salinus TaxID=2899784 RepID=UPI003561E58A